MNGSGSESGTGDDPRDEGRRSGRGSEATGSAPSRLVKLRILDKQVQLACHPDEEAELMQAAAYIDRAMRELRQRNATSSIEKIAIVTAINTASSLLKARSRAGEENDARERVNRLVAELDIVLSEEPEPPAATREGRNGEDPAGT